MDRQRQIVLAGLLTVLGMLTLLLLRGVLGTVFLAITVAYVLYPVQRWLRGRGFGMRLAAGLSTLAAFLATVAVITPLVVVLYLRRADFFAFLNNLPPQLTLEFADLTYTVDVDALLSVARDMVTAFAGELARAMPTLALEGFLFVLLIYGLLLRPDSLRGAVLRPIPSAYHDIVLALHERTRSTLYGLYLLQGATAVATFAVAWLTFTLLGYNTPFVLAALAGILQFIPILGPSLLVLGLGAFAVVEGQLSLAITVTIVGLVLVAFLPDAVIRPRLAALTTGLPASLYFIGFVGGVLSVGVVGVIAGPLIVALVSETVSLLSPNGPSIQQQIE